ncbi:hypothetical protein TRICI_003192 [Trichomonascus ciferrii]|uniref:Triosephosphate isomerase n=1 Tax=Trichomonascus ciferrii TaxID=44093 RepID=A0A642V4I6_9ASCO|nr:hypothetical protein TRICI_003192 [Trichomonascus ciferrii]
MNGTFESIKTIVDGLNNASLDPKAEVVIAPPFPYLSWTKEHVKASNVAVSAQNAYERGDGAYTGEVSVSQLKDVGASWVILGHSERRHVLKETDEFIAAKVKFAIDNGLSVIFCIGETLDERKADKTMAVNQRQIDAVVAKLDKSDWEKVVIAYEPVWAIGTGLAATPEDAQEVHAAIRKYLTEKVDQSVADKTRILYGGSVNGKNAKTFNEKQDVDGYLVGGASLKPEFIDIVNARQ